MLTKAQTADLVAFAVGCIVLFPMFPYMMLWSIKAAAWLSGAVFEQPDNVDLGGFVFRHAALACFFGMLFLIVDVTKRVVRCFV